MAEQTSRLLHIIKQLAVELHPELQSLAVELDSSLDRDLGLDSLARMELLARLEKQFAIRLSEKVLAEAETPRDLLRHLDGLGHDAPCRCLVVRERDVHAWM